MAESSSNTKLSEGASGQSNSGGSGVSHEPKKRPQSHLCEASCLFNGFKSEPLPTIAHVTTKLPGRPSASERLYTPLCDWQIRILRLRPGQYGSPLIADLQVADVLHDDGVLLHDKQERVRYDSLSHCWGTQEFTYPLLLRDCTFPITESVYHALQRVRYRDQDRYLWVDAVCINQEDDAEKSQQVSKMLTIFKKASHVVIWLGENVKETKLVESYFLRSADVLKAARHAKGSAEGLISICDTHASSLITGLTDLLHRPWYDRAWIKQEIWAARQPTMLCGDFNLPKDFMSTGPGSRLAALASGVSASQRLNLERINTRIKHLQASLVSASPQLLLKAEQNDVHNPLLQNDERYALDLVNVLRRSVGSRCSDPRDHVYAVIGMSTAPKASKPANAGSHTLRIDYTRSACEVFRDVALYLIMRERDLSVLFLDATYGAEVDGLKLPSWVPDWRRATQPMAIILSHLDAMYRRAKLTLESLLAKVRFDIVTARMVSSTPLALRLRGRSLAILKDCGNCVQSHGYQLTSRYSITYPQPDHLQDPTPSRTRQHTVARYTAAVGTAHIAFKDVCPCETNGASLDDWSILFLCE